MFSFWISRGLGSLMLHYCSWPTSRFLCKDESIWSVALVTADAWRENLLMFLAWYVSLGLFNVGFYFVVLRAYFIEKPNQLLFILYGWLQTFKDSCEETTINLQFFVVNHYWKCSKTLCWLPSEEPFELWFDMRSPVIVHFLYALELKSLKFPPFSHTWTERDTLPYSHVSLSVEFIKWLL